jgi:hypothetical protein
MKSNSLSTVVQSVIENDRVFGKNLVETYRAGGSLMLDRLDQGMELIMERSPFINDSVKSYLLDVGKSLKSFSEKSVEAVSDRAEGVIDRMSEGAADAVGRVATRAEKVQNSYASQYLEFVSRLYMPGAQLAREFTDRLADRSNKLSEYVANRSESAPVKAVKRAVKKTKVKAAKRAGGRRSAKKGSDAAAPAEAA